MVRGEVFRVPGAKRVRGREQAEARYAVVVQSDDLLNLSTVLVAPTSTSAHPATFRPPVEILGTPTRVLVEQTMVSDLERLGKSAGRLDAAEMQSLDDALRSVLGL